MPACGGHGKGWKTDRTATESLGIRDTASATGAEEEACVQLIWDPGEAEEGWDQEAVCRGILNQEPKLGVEAQQIKGLRLRKGEGG